MGISLGGVPRVPVFSGTAAEMAAYPAPVAGDLWYTTDTKKVYTYDGAAWTALETTALSGASLVLLETKTLAATASADFTSISSSYKYFILIFEVLSSEAGTTNLLMRCNNDSGNNYDLSYHTNAAVSQSINQSAFVLSQFDSGQSTAGQLTIPQKARGSTLAVPIGAVIGGEPSYNQMLGGKYQTASGDISRLTVYPSAGTLTGTASLYGVKTA